MDERPGESEAAVNLHRPSVAATPKPKRKPAAASSSRPQAVTVSQVSLMVPRHILAKYDEISELTGINRAHLMREALIAYGVFLEGGLRMSGITGVLRAG